MFSAVVAAAAASVASVAAAMVALRLFQIDVNQVRSVMQMVPSSEVFSSRCCVTAAVAAPGSRSSIELSSLVD